MGFNQRAEIKILRRPFGLAEAGEIHAIGHGLILQITFTALITNRTIQRVVDQ